MPRCLPRIILLLLLSLLPLRAETFPERPVEVIVPFGAGGGSDTFVRILQKAIREENLSPHPLIIRNAGGAGGTIGSRQARDATPDGYTIMCLHDGIYTAQHYGNATWGPADFEPIAATGRSGVVIAVAENSHYEDLASLMADAVDRPYTLVFGTNIGAPNHYSALFLQAGKPGAKFRFTQTGGGAKRLAQVKGGHVDVTGFSVAEYLQFKEAGIRALAVLGEERVADLDEAGLAGLKKEEIEALKERVAHLQSLPTAREQGVDATHSLVQFWWAPKGTPADRVAAHADLLERAMATDQVRERLAQLQIEPLFLTGAPLRDAVAERSALLADIEIEAAASLPPLEWIILGLALICGAWVVVENVRARSPRAPSETAAT